MRIGEMATIYSVIGREISNPMKCIIKDIKDSKITVHVITTGLEIDVLESDLYQKIPVVYHVNGLEHIKQFANGDWIDLRAAEDVVMKQGEFRLISLGISMKLPMGHEAIVAPRSSTFKNFGIIQTNGIGVIDESYCGNDDIWKFPALAMRDTEIHKNDRICQFRLFKHQQSRIYNPVGKLDGANRGGFGSTGVM